MDALNRILGREVALFFRHVFGEPAF